MLPSGTRSSWGNKDSTFFFKGTSKARSCTFSLEKNKKNDPSSPSSSAADLGRSKEKEEEETSELEDKNIHSSSAYVLNEKLDGVVTIAQLTMLLDQMSRELG